MIEKRQFERINFRNAVQFLIPGKERATGCLSRDLSAGGMGLNTSDFIPINTESMINFALKSGEILRLIAKVVWIQRVPHGERYQLGMQFVDKSPNYFGKQKIHQYIESRRS